MQKNKKTAIKRIIMCVAVFLVPTFVKVTFGILKELEISDVGYLSCFEKANVEEINNIAEMEALEKEMKEEEYSASTPTDPQSGRTIVSSSGSSGGNNNTSTSTTEESTEKQTVNPSAEGLVDAMKKIDDKIREDHKNKKYWTYGWSGSKGTFEEAVKTNTRHFSCVNLAAWALIDAGVLKSGQWIQN